MISCAARGEREFNAQYEIYTDSALDGRPSIRVKSNRPGTSVRAATGISLPSLRGETVFPYRNAVAACAKQRALPRIWNFDADVVSSGNQ